MTKIVAISDSHGSHFGVKIPDGDVLVHAGDVSSRGGVPDTMDFLNWFNTHPHPHKIFIAGNHDALFEQNPGLAQSLLKQFPDIHYLQDSGIELDGLKFWGSPVSPRFFNWSFNRDRGEEIKRHWDMIPNDTDVLITHGPPYGICDEVYEYNVKKHVGCRDLLDAIKRIRPQVWIGGHVHGGYGQSYIKHNDEGTTFLFNSSVVNEDYVVSNLPHVIDIFDI